ncbi:MAG: alkaline phosphatase family protein [Candidatus Cybelea sp.]
MNSRHWALALFIGAAIAACAGGSQSGEPSANGLLPGAGTTGSTPIKHVVIIIQENRSFDNLFATFPGANGTTTGLAAAMPAPVASACAAEGQPVITKPTTVPLTKVTLVGVGFPGNFGKEWDLPHVYPSGYLAECNSADWSHPSASNPCKMDGADLTYSGPNGEGPQATCLYTYQYVDPQQIQPYWDLAKDYVLADNTFQTQGSGTFTAHQDLIAGGTVLSGSNDDSVIDNPTGFPWGCDSRTPGPSAPGAVTSLITTYGQYLLDKGPYPCFTYETMRDLLDAKSVPWKYYSFRVYPWYGKDKGDTPGIWSAFDAISAVRHSKEWGTKVTYTDMKIFADVKDGRLPAVAWLTPDAANSDHPQEGCKCDHGPSWVASVVNAIGESKYWKSSAIIVLWDDWGGFYDHVPPPFYDDAGGLGFRVPMLIVSPYVQAHVEHTQYEYGSILKFIENNWNLGSLGTTDKRATSIGNAFDFTRKPRKFQKIPSAESLQFFLHQKPSGIPPDTE